jgi:4-methylaminobutanoate oxidase (formaldehyde-forming)
VHDSLIDRAAVAIVGGGILGCSIAWHLARRGTTDVVVIERNGVATAATARAAGLIARGRLHAPTLAMVARTRAAIAELEDALGESAGFTRVGSVRVTSTAGGADALARMDGMLAAAGVAVHGIDAADAQRLVPWLEAGSAHRISYVEDDGYADPYRLASAYARAARALGVRFLLGTAVQRVLHDGTRVTGVATDRGAVGADAVVNAGGAWAIELAAAAGGALGTAPVRSHYFITAPISGWPRAHPLVYLPDARAYARPEVGGLLLGVQEPRSRTYDARTLPADAGDFRLAEENEEWAVLGEHAAGLRTYIPRLDELPLAHHIAGLSTYTPDGRFLLGRCGPIERLYVAGGCCGTGVAASGGIGGSLASLVLDEPPDIDLTDFAPDRFGPVDPYSEAFRERCAAARAGKLRLG